MVSNKNTLSCDDQFQREHENVFFAFSSSDHHTRRQVGEKLIPELPERPLHVEILNIQTEHAVLGFEDGVYCLMKDEIQGKNFRI